MQSYFWMIVFIISSLITFIIGIIVYLLFIVSVLREFFMQTYTYSKSCQEYIAIIILFTR
jgi:hypothetical protein